MNWPEVLAALIPDGVTTDELDALIIPDLSDPRVSRPPGPVTWQTILDMQDHWRLYGTRPRGGVDLDWYRTGYEELDPDAREWLDRIVGLG